MIDTLNQARNILDEKKATLVLMKDAIVFVSDKKGITPLIELAEKGTYEGYTASDLIVGKAAALLYTLLKVKAIYAVVITKEAKWTSWAELKALSEAGKLGEVLKSGDNIPVTLKNGEEVSFDESV